MRATTKKLYKCILFWYSQPQMWEKNCTVVLVNKYVQVCFVGSWRVSFFTCNCSKLGSPCCHGNATVCVLLSYQRRVQLMEADRIQALPVGRQDTTKVQPQNKSENPGIMILSFDITVKTPQLLTRVLTDSSEWLLDRGHYQFLFLRSAQTLLCPVS